MESTAVKVIQPVFQPIKDAVKTTELSEWYMRQALKNGTAARRQKIDDAISAMKKQREEVKE